MSRWATKPRKPTGHFRPVWEHRLGGGCVVCRPCCGRNSGPRFRGGSTPDDDVPSAAMIRDVLTGAREHLLATLRAMGDDRFDEIPEALRERKIAVRDVFSLLAWHEARHQGQAHLTLNLYKASR